MLQTSSYPAPYSDEWYSPEFQALKEAAEKICGWDFVACWEENGFPTEAHDCGGFHYEAEPGFAFTPFDIKEMIAMHEGENDGDNWRWIFALKNGTFGAARGGCDYTGWD